MDASDEIMRQSESERARVDDLLTANQAEFDRKYQENEQAIRGVDANIETLDDKIVDLNEMVGARLISNAFSCIKLCL